MDAIEEDERSKENIIADVPLTTEKEESETPPLPPKEPPVSIDWAPLETGAFAGPLHSIIDPVSMRRTVLAGEIEVLRTRAVAAEELSLQLRLQIETKQNEIHQLNDYLSACSLVAEQGRLIEPLLETIKPIKSSTSHYHLSSGPNSYTSGDCLRTFQEDPATALSTAEVIARAPLAKRADAKKRISMRIGYLFDVGKLERVFTGIYRLKTAAKAPVEEAAQPEETRPEPEETPIKPEKTIVVKAVKPVASNSKKVVKSTQPGKKRKNNGTGNEAMPDLPRRVSAAVPARKHYARHPVTPQ